MLAKLKWTWTNQDDEPWEYTAELPLHKKGLRWSTELTPTVLHPDLEDGRVLVSQQSPGERGAIFGEDDEELMAEGKTVNPLLVLPAGGEDESADESRQEIDAEAAVPVAKSFFEMLN